MAIAALPLTQQLHTSMNLLSKKSLVQLTAACSLATISLAFTSCQNAGQGALSGAAIGATGGALIGNQSGEAGKGALIGGLGGAAVGGLIGNENQKKSQTNYRGQQPYYGSQPQYRGQNVPY